MYAFQFHLLRRWTGGPAALIRRAIETAAVAAIALWITAWLTSRVAVPSVGSVVALGLAVTIVPAAARPLLVAMVSRVSLALVGLATLLVRTIVFWLFARATVGNAESTLGDAFVAAAIFALINAVLTASLSLGDDKSFFGTLVRQLAVRYRDVVPIARTGLVVIQIDGLAREVLQEQIHAGRATTLSRWISTGGMRLDPWETLLPSQTSASQAGILHGNGDQIPGFRWWDKATGRFLVSNHPPDAHEMQRRVSNGQGLLCDQGASISNLLSGDATRSYLTAATARDPARELRRTHVLAWFFGTPYAAVRWLSLMVGEVIKELIQARQAAASGAPSAGRGFTYAFARAATNVLLRHLSTALVIEEMYRGAAIIYVDFVDYDEIAHKSGPRSVEALGAIEGVDRILAIVERAALDTPRPYRFVVLSDHGQSPGATFRERHGRSFEDTVGALANARATTGKSAGRSERWGSSGALLVGSSGDGDANQAPEIVVGNCGNLANVSFPRLPGRASMEAIDRIYPGLIAGLVRHPGIGVVMVRSESRGAVVRGAVGDNYLSDGRIEGIDPLERFGPHAAQGLKGLDAMSACGDLVVISQYEEVSGEVAGFEAQIGSHGGLGGIQTQPFILHPSEWPVDPAIVGAPAVFDQLRRWRDRLS